MAKMQLVDRCERTLLGLVRFRHLVSVAVVRIPELVARARPMLSLGSSCSAPCWARPGHGGPGGQPHDRVQVNLPTRCSSAGSYDVGGLAVNVFRVRCLYFCAGTGGGCVATGAYRLPGLRSPLLRDRVLGPTLTASQDFVFVLPQRSSRFPSAWVDGHTVCAAALAGRSVDLSSQRARRRFCRKVAFSRVRESVSH